MAKAAGKVADSMNRTSVKRLGHILFAPALLAGIVILFLWPVILPPAGQVPGAPSPQGSDVVGQFYPWSRLFVEGVRRGQLVLWNPYSFLGKPFQAHPQTAEFYPLTWLFVWLDAGQAFGVALAFHLWAAAFGMYLLARTWGVSRFGALLSGVAFVLGGFVTSKIFVGFHDIFGTMAWMPWAMAAMQWAWTRRRIGYAALAGLPIALSALAGSMTFLPFTLIAVIAQGLYLAARSWRAESWRGAWRATAQLALALGCGLALSAVQLLPTLELASLSTRAVGVTYEFAAERPFPITHLLMLLMPDIFGAPVGPGEYWGADWYHELQIYIGIAPLALALTALWRGDHRKWFFAGLGGAALIYALGPEGYLHTLFYRIVPGLGLVRLPGRANVLFALSAAVLAGIGWDTWTAWADQDHLERMPGARGFVAASLIALATGLFAFIEAALRAGDAGVSARLMLVAGQVLRFAALAGVTYLVLRWRWRGSSRRVFAVAILALTLLDLGAFGTKFISTQPAPPNSTWWPLADRVMAKEREQYRVLEYVVEHTIEPGTNDHILFHLQNLNGYDPLMLPDAIELTEVNYGLEEKLLDMLAVRYILLSETTKIDTSGLRQVAQQNGVIVYERPHPQARAFVVHRLQVAPHTEVLAQLLDPAFDPRSAAIVEAPPGCALAESAGQDSVTLTRDEMNRVVLETHAGSDGFLVMSDAFYPGWRAEVDGQPRPVVRANYALRGICLPAGDHRVVFSFEPATLRAGIWVSLLGLVAVIGSISGERLFRRPGC